MSDGATVKDLLALLEIPESLGAVVIVYGRIQKKTAEIKGDETAQIFVPIHGG